MPRRAATTSATPLAWPTDMAVRALFWNSTRSTATAEGPSSRTRPSSSSASSARRWASGSWGEVRTTPYATARGLAPPPVTAPYPQRETPGSIPSTGPS